MLLTVNFLLCALGIIAVAWVAVRMLRPDRPVREDDTDGDGGVPYPENLPVIDLPPGSRLDDLLTDRDPTASPIHSPLIRV